MSWVGIAPLKTIAPPILLDVNEEVIEGKTRRVIVYGPTKDGTLEKLAPKFPVLCWACEDEMLGRERAIQDMLGQIEQDLAVCDVKSLSRLFTALSQDVGMWWKEASQTCSPDSALVPAMILLKGAIKILFGVNWWRRWLRRPILEPNVDHTSTLEWTLSSQLLRCFEMQSVQVFDNWLHPADTKPHGISPREVLEAIPYLYEGKVIMNTIKDDGSLRPDDRRHVTDWLNAAKELPNQ